MQLNKWFRIAWVILIALLFAGGVRVATNGFAIQKDIFSVLPDLFRDQGFLAAQKKYQDLLGRQLVLAVVAPSADEAKKQVELFVTHLKKTQNFSKFTYHFDSSDVEKIRQFYFPLRQQLLRPAEVKKLGEQSNEGILKNELAKFYSPWGSSQLATLDSDPFGYFIQFASGLKRPSTIEPDDGYLVSPFEKNGEKKFVAFVFSEIAGLGQNYGVQKNAIESIREYREQYQNQFGHDGGDILMLGVAPYVNASVEQAKVEISTIGLGSMIGVALLLLLVFRSLTPLVTTSLLVVVTMGISTLLTELFFGSIHFFTLVLGSSLVGLITDYAFLFFSQRFDSNVTSGLQARDQVKMALAYAYVSTVFGFGFLFFAGFPILRQMATFSLIGFSSAVLMVWTFFPHFHHKNLKLSRLAEVGGQFIGKIFGWPKKYLLIGLPIVFVAICIASTRIRFDDNIKKLQTPPKNLKSQEEDIKKMLGSTASQLYLIVRGESVEAMLRTEEILVEILKDHFGTQSFGVSQWVPSESTQKKSYDEYQKLSAIVPAFYEKLRVPKEKQLQWHAKQELMFAPFNIEDWQKEFADLPVVNQYLGDIGGQFYSIVMLPEAAASGAADLKTLNSEHVHFMNVAEDTSLVMSKVRQTIIAAGIVGVFVLFCLLVFMKNWECALFVVVPPAMAAILSLELTFLALGPLGLFNILGAILVFSVGSDYTFFYYNCRNTTVTPTVLAVTSCVICTGLSFGLMALSQTAAIEGFGVTLALGIFLSYVLSPVALRAK